MKPRHSKVKVGSEEASYVHSMHNPFTQHSMHSYTVIYTSNGGALNKKWQYTSMYEGVSIKTTDKQADEVTRGMYMIRPQK